MKRRGGFVAMILMLALAGCHVQKRLYMKGWHLSRKGQSHVMHAGVSTQERLSCAASAEFVKSPRSVSVEESTIPSTRAGVAVQHNRVHGLLLVKPETKAEKPADGICMSSTAKKRVVDPWGMIAFGLSIGAWFTMGYVTLPLFILAAVLAVVSLNKMGQAPDRYVLKTLSLVALIISVIGAALSLFTLVLLLFS